MMSIPFAILLVLLQMITGAYFWTLIRPRSRSLERLGIGLALGSGASVLSGVVLFDALPLVWAVLVPSLVAVSVAVLLQIARGSYVGSRVPIVPSGFGNRPAAVAVVIGLVAGLVAIAINLARYPLSWNGTVSSYHGDFLFFEALSTSLATLGPDGSIFMSGAEIRYHWMVYAWAGQIAELAGTEPFFVLTRVLPVVSLVGSVLIVAAWTVRLTRVAWAPSVAVLLLVSGGYVGATYGTILNFDSPSQQLATVWMLGGAMALWETTRRISKEGSSSDAWKSLGARFWMLLGAAGLLAAVAASGKASVAAVLIAGWALVPIVGLVRRERWAVPSLLGLAVALLGAGVATVAFVAGSQDGGGIAIGGFLDKASSVQGLNPVSAPWGIAVGTVLLMLAVSYRWAGLVWLAADEGTRWQPITIFGMGLAASGLGALVLLSEGINDTWFPLAASAPLAVISAAGVARATQAVFPHHSPRSLRNLITVALSGVVASLVVVWLWSLAPGTSTSLRWVAPLAALALAVLIGYVLAPVASPNVRRLHRVVALTLIALVSMSLFSRGLGIWSDRFGVQPEQGLTALEFRPGADLIDSIDRQPVTEWSDTEIAAAQWLRDEVADGELLATNVTYSPLVPALTGLPTFISGINYQAPYGREGIRESILEREQLSMSFVSQPTAELARGLCESGVTWLWVDPRRPNAGTWTPWGETVMSQDQVQIIRLNTDRCFG